MARRLEQRLESFPLLERNERLYTMARAAVVIGQEFLRAPLRTDMVLPSVAEEKGIKLISSFEPGVAVYGKQNKKDVQTAGTYYLVHGVNGYINYRHGAEVWDVSIAWIKDDQIRSGVVYVPELNGFYYASLGEGAFFNRKPLKDPLPQRPLREALIEVAPLFDRGSQDPREAKNVRALRRTIEDLADEYPTVTREAQSGGKSLAELARGIWDAYLSSWTGKGNLPAGVAIARERGVVVTNIEGEEWQPGNLGVIAATPYLYPILFERLQRHYREAR